VLVLLEEWSDGEVRQVDCNNVFEIGLTQDPNEFHVGFDERRGVVVVLDHDVVAAYEDDHDVLGVDCLLLALEVGFEAVELFVDRLAHGLEKHFLAQLLSLTLGVPVHLRILIQRRPAHRLVDQLHLQLLTQLLVPDLPVAEPPIALQLSRGQVVRKKFVQQIHGDFVLLLIVGVFLVSRIYIGCVGELLQVAVVAQTVPKDLYFGVAYVRGLRHVRIEKYVLDLLTKRN